MGKTIYNEILETASDLFYFKGYDSTSMADIAKECGCTKQALSYHFGSKEEMGKQVCLRYISNLSAGFFRIVTDAVFQEDELTARIAYLLWSGAPFYAQDENAFRFYKEFIYKYPDLSALQADVCDMYVSFFELFSKQSSDAYMKMCAYKALYASSGLLYKYVDGQISCSLEEFQHFYLGIFLEDIIPDKKTVSALYRKAQSLIDAHTFRILPNFCVTE